MTAANLTCYRAACHGEFRYLGESRGALYECEECGAELEQGAIEDLANGDGPVGAIARALLNGGA